MKQTFINLLSLSLFAVSAIAQPKQVKESRVYLRVGGSYTVRHASQINVGSMYANGNIKVAGSYAGSVTNTQSENVDIQKVSLGAGINGIVAGGVMFSKHIGLELAVGIGLSPKKYTFKFTADETQTAPTTSVHIEDKTVMYQKLPILVMPSFVLQTDGEKINVYSRLGVALPVSGKMITERDYTETQAGNPTTFGATETWETTMRFALGFQGALGAQLRIDDKFAFYVEVNGLSMNAYAKKATLTGFTFNGTDQLSALDVADKQKEYEFSYTKVNVPGNSNLPDKAPTFSVPYSNFGFGVGFVLGF